VFSNGASIFGDVTAGPAATCKLGDQRVLIEQSHMGPRTLSATQCARRLAHMGRRQSLGSEPSIFSVVSDGYIGVDGLLHVLSVEPGTMPPLDILNIPESCAGAALANLSVALARKQHTPETAASSRSCESLVCHTSS